jgi:beta-glucosidase
VSFNWTIFNPDGTLFPTTFGEEGFSVVWTGTMECPETFDGLIGFDGEDSVKIYIDGELILDCWGENRFEDRLVPFHFEEGKIHSVRIEFTNDQQGADVRFGYRKGYEDFTAAVEAAKKAQVAIVCVGDSGETSGENFDRIDLNLPGNQLALVKAIYATGTPVVLLFYTGRPVTCTWEQKHIPAILQCFFPGERGAYAVVDTLFGDNNPSGHLTVTYPRHVGQVPCHYTRRPGGGRQYVEMSWTPLYPFGYGLSYTDFEYRGLKLSSEKIAAGETVTAYVTVANVGDRAGVAVPQLYIRDWVSSTVKPERYLCGFKRVELEPGEEKTVEITIGERSMRTLDPNYVWHVEPGKFTVYLGENCEKLYCNQTFWVE